MHCRISLGSHHSHGINNLTGNEGKPTFPSRWPGRRTFQQTCFIANMTVGDLATFSEAAAG